MVGGVRHTSPLVDADKGDGAVGNESTACAGWSAAIAIAKCRAELPEPFGGNRLPLTDVTN